MKHLVIAIMVLVLIFALGIYEQVYVKGTLKHVIDTSNKIIDLIESQDMDGAKCEVDALVTYFDERQEYLELIFSHNEFKDIPILLGELQGNIKVQDSAQAIVRAYVIRNDAKCHLDNLTLSIVNIL